ncbi:YcjF family protein [Chromobacterium sp. ATCC 53434]|uniref:YcjF family protein n=1 Tax=Chromobacterium sp. (strain ATCC 53434 / SC 14030) TaxID=2059672 RepID=UPI00130513B3|nr:DUF697 domain-containing protein [Chromobacterium sp. ATCC 53434]
MVAHTETRAADHAGAAAGADAGVESHGASGREAEALALMRSYMPWAAGAGLVPVPLLDMAVIAGVQLKFLARLSALYQVPFSENQAKSIIAALLGSVVPASLATTVFSLLKGIPLLGFAASFLTLPALGAASTYALGKVFIQHFESGGTFLNFDPQKVRSYYQEQFEQAKK